MFPSSSTCAGYTLSLLGFWLDCRQHKCREVLAVKRAREQNMQKLRIAALHVAHDFVLDPVSNELVHVLGGIM